MMQAPAHRRRRPKYDSHAEARALPSAERQLPGTEAPFRISPSGQHFGCRPLLSLKELLCPRRPYQSRSPDLRGNRLRAAGRGRDRCPADDARPPEVLAVQDRLRVLWNDNWEIFVMNADGSQPKKLTSTRRTRSTIPRFRPMVRRSASRWNRRRSRRGPQPVGDGHRRQQSQKDGGKCARAFLESGQQGHRLSAPGVSSSM